MATDTSIYMLEEHTGLTGSVAHGTSEARHSCHKFLSITEILEQLVPVFQFPNRPPQCVLQSVWKLTQVKTKIW